MAKVILTSSDSQYTVAGGNNAEVIGTTGAETISIQPGATVVLDASFNKGGDTLVLTGNASNYTMQLNGATVILRNNADGTTIEVPAGTAGADVQFADGTRELKIDNGAVMLGDSQVTATETAVAEGGPVTYSMAADTASVTEGNAVTFTVTASGASDTDTVLNYQLSGVDVAGGTADPATDLGNVTGEVTIPAGQTSATFTVTPTDDGVTEGFEGFNVTLLDGNFTTVATSSNVVIKDGATAGQVFALTAGTDTIQGTSGDDTVNGVLQAAGADGTTLAPGDSFDGGDGTDTLNISVAGGLAADTPYTLSAIQTNSVENVFLSNFDTKTGGTTEEINIVDAALMNGLTTVGLSASSATGDTQFDGLKNLVAAEMRNGAGDLELSYNAAVVAGDADAQTLTISNVSGGTFTANGTESITVSTELVASELTNVVSDELETLTITGDQDLTITDALDFAASGDGAAIDGTVDASAMTGALTVTASSAETVSVTAGSGDDTINMGSQLTTNDVIDGGDGVDTLTMAAAALTTQFSNVSNVEKVAFNAVAAAVTLDASALSAGVTEVIVDTSDATAGDTSTDSAITNLDGQSVTIKHTVADTETDAGDGVQYTLTNAVDTAADSVSVKLDAIGAEADDLGVEHLVVDSYETVNLESAASATVTANELENLSVASAAAVVLTGDADLTIGTVNGGAMTSLDASAMTGQLTATFASDDDVTATAAQDDTSFDFGTTLDNNDTVVGGAGDDVVIADVSGATATTGALNISGVETLNLDVETNAATIDAAGITGAESINVFVDAGQTSGDVTLNNLAAGVAIGLGKAAGDEANGTVTAVLADASGDADALTVNINANDTNDDIDAAVVVADVETVTIAVSETTADVQLDVSDVDAATLNVSGGLDEEELDLTNGGTSKLSTSTTVVDASGLAGHLVVDASETNAPAITITANGSTTTANNITGSGNDDTINISGATDAAETVDGGDGTDTLNIDVKNGFTDGSSVSNVEVVNLNVKAGEDINTSGGTGFNDAELDTLNVLGGNSLSTATLSHFHANVEAIDASNFGGNIAVSFDQGDVLDDTVTITGGALATDSVTAAYGTAGTYTPTTSGIETLNVSMTADDNGDVIVDVSDMVGLTTINVTQNTSVDAEEELVIDGLTTSHTVVMDGALAADSVVTASVDSATGTADVVNVEYDSASVGDGHRLKITDVETVNIDVTQNASVDLSLVTNTQTNGEVAINLTGAGDFVINDATVIDDSVTTIDASAMTGGLDTFDTLGVGTGAKTTATTIIGGHAADIISGGAAADTFTGNDGADNFVAATHSNKFIYDTITDAANGDTITFTDQGAETGWAQIELAGAAGFTDYLDEAAKGDGNTNGIFKWFVFEDNTYIVQDASSNATFTAGTDTVIQLTGVLDLSQSTGTTTNVITLDIDGA